MKKIHSIVGVLIVVDLLRRLMAWGIVEPLLLRKEMAVSDGWDGRSWDFPGGLLMSPPSYTGLRRLWLHLLLVLLDGGAVAEGTLVIF